MTDYVVSDEEKQTIIQNFLLNAPPGEFIEVVQDVKFLLNDDTLLNSVAPSAFKEYNTEQFSVVTKGDLKGIVTKFGEVENDTYLEPVSRRVFAFNQIKQEVGDISDGSRYLNGSHESFRAAVQSGIQDYVSSSYQENGAYGVYDTDSGVTLVITSVIFNPDNFWNGRWRSVWNAAIRGGTATITGNIRLDVHYYEEGNVQLKTHKEINAQIGASDANTFAREFVEQVTRIEGDFHRELTNNYDTMSTTTFKALRRALPIFRTLIKWDNLGQYDVSM